MLKNITAGLIEMYQTNNPFELCDYLNIKIIRSNLGSEIKGFFQRTVEGYEIIHINSKLNDNESKYICAHELGHAIMHTDLSLQFFIENPLQIKSKYEIQADKFAAELLIPDNLESYECELEGMTAEELGCYFGVPKELIEYKFGKEVI